jgi:hypothetical protein
LTTVGNVPPAERLVSKSRAPSVKLKHSCGLGDIRPGTNLRDARFGEQKVVMMVSNALSFILGAVAPLAGVAWLLYLH